MAGMWSRGPEDSEAQISLTKPSGVSLRVQERLGTATEVSCFKKVARTLAQSFLGTNVQGQEGGF